MSVLNHILRYFPFFNFFVGFFSATCLLLTHLSKRRYWRVWIASLVFIYLSTGVILLLLQVRLTFGDSIIALSAVFYLIMTLLLWACCKITFTEALFGAICAYVAEHFANAIAMAAKYTVSYFFDYSINDRLTHMLCYLGLYLVLNFTVFRKLKQNGKLYLHTKKTVAVGILVFLVVSALYSRVIIERKWEENLLAVYALVYDSLCCACFLYLQVARQQSARFREDLRIERMLRKRQAEQYILTRDNIAIIERKCHDLKHQIVALRSIDNPEAREKSIEEIEKAIMIYGSVMKTGSDVLDTVLMDKYLFCEQHGITWTCMADGSKLDFIDPVDLYVLFANALDNAIEAVQNLEDPEQRAIRVKVYTKYHMLFLEIENYYDRPFGFKDGIPQTTKQQDGDHGFGLRSIQYTVLKYGGMMQIQAEHDIFALHITIPLP